METEKEKRMSYEIVKTIKIVGNEVIYCGASNNVWPRDYRRIVDPHYTTMLQECGRAAVELNILRMYEEGIFQAGYKTKYWQAAERLRSMPEYAAFDWRGNRTVYGSPEYKAFQESRRSDKFEQLMRKALKRAK